MRLIVIALCALLMLAARPSSSQDCPETESTVTREAFHSERLGRDVMVSVVLKGTLSGSRGSREPWSGTSRMGVYPFCPGVTFGPDRKPICSGSW